MDIGRIPEPSKGRSLFEYFSDCHVLTSICAGCFADFAFTLSLSQAREHHCHCLILSPSQFSPKKPICAPDLVGYCVGVDEGPRDPLSSEFDSLILEIVVYKSQIQHSLIFVWHQYISITLYTINSISVYIGNHVLVILRISHAPFGDYYVSNSKPFCHQNQRLSQNT